MLVFKVFQLLWNLQFLAINHSARNISHHKAWPVCDTVNLVTGKQSTWDWNLG